MTLELKQYPIWFDDAPKPYLLDGVKEITNQTEYGFGHHAITIFDRRVFITDAFEYIRDIDTGKYYVKDGKWVGYETMNEWISVKDRLPEEEQDVLMFFDGESNTMAVGGRCESGDGWYSILDSESYTDCDTPPLYWTPLPKPPKDEEEETV